MKQIFTYYIGLLLLIGFAQANAEYIRPVNKMAKEVSEILYSRKFDKIEALAEKLRKNDTPLSDGQPAIFAFYSGVSKCVEMNCDDEELSTDDWIKHRSFLEEWNTKYPNSFTAKLAIAKYMKEYGWKKRGLGFSNSVTQTQWDEFKSLIEQSRIALEKIEYVKNKDPIWYDTMLSILKIQNPHSKEFNDTYNQAIKSFPYYLPFYFTKASEASPRWGGTIFQFTIFVNSTVKNTQEKLGETMYARLNWSSYDPEMFKNGQADWNRMKAGFVRMTDDYPDPWNINNFARFACIAGDFQTLGVLLKKIADSPIPEAWRPSGLYDQCKTMSQQINQ